MPPTQSQTGYDKDKKLLVFPVPGDVLSTTAGALRAELDQALGNWTAQRASVECFEADLRAARMVDSVGLNLLVWLWRAVSSRGARLRLRIASPDIERTFRFTRLSDRVEVAWEP